MCMLSATSSTWLVLLSRICQGPWQQHERVSQTSNKVVGLLLHSLYYFLYLLCLSRTRITWDSALVQDDRSCSHILLFPHTEIQQAIFFLQKPYSICKLKIIKRANLHLILISFLKFRLFNVFLLEKKNGIRDTDEKRAGFSWNPPLFQTLSTSTLSIVDHHQGTWSTSGTS